jgi:glutaminase
MSGLDNLSKAQLTECIEQAKARAAPGRIVDRIPLLKAVDPDWLAVQIHTTQQASGAGEVNHVFPLMSVIKPFTLLYLLEKFGSHLVFQWVGVDPSDRAFNSLGQLTEDKGYPRNPMINSGAIALAGKLPGKTGHDRCLTLCNWINQQADCQIQLDEAMLASVQSAGRGTNQALAELLAQSGYLEDPEITLDTYEQICCLSGSVVELAKLGLLLSYDRSIIRPTHRRIVTALMLTCGLYEASSRYAVQIGLPIKSGISGALLTIVPGAGAIACYSPALDAIGNPTAALALIEVLAEHLNLSIF